jgi:glycosyltransferase involved in cell wall biosynthesis
MRISVVTPVFNEEHSIPTFLSGLKTTLTTLGAYEIIAVDDGSRDGSFRALRDAAKKDAHIKVIRLAANCGQTAALSAGIEAARGDIIVLIDSDLENDPADISLLIKKIENDEADVVSGWREKRWAGATLSRRVPSIVANWLISTVTKVPLNDYGCTLKAYRREIIQDVSLYGEMHRFIPAYAAQQGARVAEMPVRYAPRVYGTSHYGLSRILRVIPDLFLFVFFARFGSRPMHLFGYAAFVSLAIAIVSIGSALYWKFADGISLILTPLPTFAAMATILGVQFLMFGFLAEMLMRTYYESQHRRPYRIKETIGFADDKK